MKLSLRQKVRVIWGMVGLTFALIFLIPLAKSLWSLLPAIGCMTAVIFLNRKWWRCPNCGEWLGRDMGKYCQHCGEKIDYDAKEPGGQ